ncbi:helix-turn-helix transcriptional regulator [Pseudoflavitalea sp. G-6-1-2]|uniref:helix-turn-helix domain-containing protein n=1 Tax=Pseudoflavitalea sp. G-6-1-2 TaxID=2728841 RepID=UPI00146E0A3E|nr:helix-turn-helix transcriptional regulator [Pseudoflavitalea sp. G-6-1-2]NML22602.1 helix-turn-helix transcriptional regulator [Pseudoflavitalea sp. G-6-1-2]
MEIYIKNMVCDRCILVVKEKLDQLQFPYDHIELGEVHLTKQPTAQQLQALKQELHSLGFELLDDKKRATVEKIKKTIIQLVHGSDEVKMTKKLSVLLQQQLQQDYQSLSLLFSSIEGITIEKYLILQRIERAKELLMYDELSLGEIASKLGYSSVQYLSSQFKKVIGLTPSHFKQIKENKRRPLDKVSG